MNKFLNSYETLNYEPIKHRLKRSADGSIVATNIRFNTHNRSFDLILYSINNDPSPVFDSQIMFDVDGIPVDFRPDEYLLHGIDKNNRGSAVYGSIQDGILDGLIYHNDGHVFTIVRANQFFPVNERPLHFHSIVYSDDSINFWKSRKKRSAKDKHGCGLHGRVRKDMEAFQKSVILDNDPVVSSSFKVHHPIQDSFPYRYFMDSQRTKRDVPETKIINGKQIYTVRACYVYLQADHKLYQHIFEKEGNFDEVRTREEIASLFYNHIKAVNQIYEDTDFNGINGVTFVIQRISLYTPQTCSGKTDGISENPFCEDNVDVSNFLNLNSRKNHSDFCLAYAFTFRDFVGGTLGLAWVASQNHNTAGGICQQYTKYSEGTNFVYRSLNTGIITLVNYGNRVPNRVSQLTLAHEIGHNFGSPHDYPLECQPGLPDGNYIMFASATSGDKKNNAQFSKCSIANISIVLSEVLQQRPIDTENSYLRLGGFGIGAGKRNCFRETKSAFCGNQVKEPGEECDCGYTAADCETMNDKCCHSRDTGSGCKRRSKATCSPSEGPCCNAQECAFHPSSAKKLYLIS